jgi:hypothetical protein
MKRSVVRVSLLFVTLPKDQLNSFAILVITCIPKRGTLFPNLPITIAALTLLQEAYEAAMTATTLGGSPQTAALKEARDNLLVPLRQIAPTSRASPESRNRRC